ncbi:MAG: PQQ-binding-like beta-propeller repeat protein [Candidatus Schekmanbacteria bacterium]|nr:PQQ-binding-like beta-propeller repeat protein [Candidatus Schekmanbacteria bacterium]
MSHRVGPYQLDSLIGSGPIGETYRATHLETSGAYVVKLVNIAPGAEPVADIKLKEAFFERCRSLRALAKLDGIAQVHSAGRTNHRFYVVRDFVEGRSIADAMKEDRAGLRQKVVTIFKGLAASLTTLHDRDLLHLRIKPENLIWCPGKALVITDPSYFVSLSASQALRELLAPAPYVAPELLTGEDLSPASDLFTLAAVLYFILTGRPPYEACADSASYLKALRKGAERPSRRNPKLSGAVDGFLHKALAFKPADRFRSADEFRTALGYLAEAGLFVESASDALAETDKFKRDELLVAKAQAAAAPGAAPRPANAPTDAAAIALMLAGESPESSGLTADEFSLSPSTEAHLDQELASHGASEGTPARTGRKAVFVVAAFAVVLVGLLLARRAGDVDGATSSIRNHDRTPQATEQPDGGNTGSASSGDATKLEIVSDPPRAEVFLAGKYRGSTPLELDLGEPGLEVLPLVVWEPGYLPRLDVVQKRHQFHSKLHVSLAPYTGSSPAVITGAWPTFRGNALRTGYLANPLLLPLSRKWDQKGPGKRQLSPVIHGDSVVTSGSQVRALALADGAERWVLPEPAPQEREVTVLAGEPPLVVTVDTAGALRIVNLLDGKVLTKYELPGAAVESLAAVDASVYVATGGSKMAAYSVARAGTTSVRISGDWVASLPIDKAYMPAIGPDHVYVQSAQRVVALARANGILAWSYELPVPEGEEAGKPATADPEADLPRPSPVVVGDMVIVASTSGLVIALDGRTGTEKWQFATRPPRPIHATPAVARGVVIIATAAGRLYAVALSPDPVLVWTFEGGSPFYSSPVIARDTVFAGTEAGDLLAFSIESGELKWKQELGAALRASIAVADGRLVASTEDGRLLCLGEDR